jgi:hypothetical protein
MHSPRYTDSYVKMSRVVVPVTALSTTIIPSTSLRTFDSAIIYLTNDGTDVLNATIEYSPDGVFPGVPAADDAFTAMAPGGPMRQGKVWYDAQFFRVVGKFAVLSGNVGVSLFMNRAK